MKEREYLKELGKKITDSSVRKEIVNEYEAHIEDCKAALMESGMTEVEAEEEAVRQMGDPQEAGEAMDKIYHKVFDSNMFLWMLALGCIPIVCVCIKASEIDYFCDIYRKMGEETHLHLCASMGLLKREELEKLKAAGVKRYHCNLETASSYFSELCTTHTIEQKKETIRTAQELGMEICSGGIIGMGETMKQRIELAFELKELEVCSVPMNILNPIPGTPLEHMPPISDEEILVTIAIFRFILPRTFIRFAGGRARLSRETQKQALSAGVNGLLMGDMLTTLGSGVNEDKSLAREAGYDPL